MIAKRIPTRADIDAACTVIRASGGPNRLAARAVGINRATYQEWLRKGRLKRADKNDPYRRFVEAVDREQAGFRARITSKIAASPDAKALQRLLESQAPDLYRPDRLERRLERELAKLRIELAKVEVEKARLELESIQRGANDGGAAVEVVIRAEPLPAPAVDLSASPDVAPGGDSPGR